MSGISTAVSVFSVAETVERMVSVIEQEGWHIFARIDHAGQAQNVQLELRPTELILFGNPAIGTQLMQDRQISGLDLPMKALVWEDEQKQVWIAHNTMAWLQERHGLIGQRTLDSIAELLAKVRTCGQK